MLHGTTLRAHHHEVPPLTQQELDAVLGTIEPPLLEALRETYTPADIQAGLSFAALRFQLAEWSERRNGLAAAFLAELTLLAPGQQDAVQREIVARGADASAVQLHGPRPVSVTFERDGAKLRLWCSVVTMNDIAGQPRAFLLVPLTALEGRPRRPDDLPELPANVSPDVTLEGRTLKTEPVAIENGVDLAILALPSGTESMAAICRLDVADESSDAVVGWVCEHAAARWCHGLRSRDTTLRRLQATGVLTPLVSARGVVSRSIDLVEHLDLSAAALCGFAVADGVLERGQVHGLVASALLKGVPVRQRLTWAVERLFPSRGDPTAANTPLVASDDPRLIDLLYAGYRGLAATRVTDLIALITVLTVLSLAVYLLGAWGLSRLLELPWGPGKFQHQVRMGLGVLMVSGLALPVLYGARAGVLATAGGAVVGLAALGLSNVLGEARTTAVASAAAGALFGAVLFLGNARGGREIWRFDRRRSWRLLTSIAYAGLVCGTGYALTRIEPLYGRFDLLAPILGLLLLALVAPVIIRLLRAGRSGVRGLLPLYGAIVACLLVLIAVGIAFARDDDLKGLFEGAAFAGIATTLLFMLAPRLRASPLATQRLILGIGLPIAVTISFSVMLTADRWLIASASFWGGLWLGSLVSALIDATIRRVGRFT